MLNDRVTLATAGGTVIDKAIAVQLAKNGSKVALPSPRPCSPSIRGPQRGTKHNQSGGPIIEVLACADCGAPIYNSFVLWFEKAG